MNSEAGILSLLLSGMATGIHSVPFYHLSFNYLPEEKANRSPRFAIPERIGRLESTACSLFILRKAASYLENLRRYCNVVEGPRYVV